MKDIKDINIDFDLSRIKESNKKTNWHRAIYYSLIISVVVFGAACIYLFFKPISQNIKNRIDEDISSINVSFDKDTLEIVKERQTPKESTESSAGKNPFSPL